MRETHKIKVASEKGPKISEKQKSRCPNKSRAFEQSDRYIIAFLIAHRVITCYWRLQDQQKYHITRFHKDNERWK